MALSSYVCLDRETMRKIETMHHELVQAVERVAGLLATPLIQAPVGEATPATPPLGGFSSRDCLNQNCPVLEFRGVSCPVCHQEGQA